MQKSHLSRYWVAAAAFFLLSANTSVFAQSRISSLSLNDAINAALGRGEEITLAEGGVHSAQGSEEVAFSGYLPQIGATVNYTRTFLSQYSGLQSLPDTGSAATLASLFKNLPFGRANAWTLGLNASENIFTGGRLTALNEAAKAREKSADIDFTAAQAQLVLNVTQSYYDAILADTVVRISHDALDEAEKVYQLTNQAFQVGEKAEFDALSAKVARDNQIPVVLQSEDNRAQAYYRLKQLLNLSLDDSLELTTPIVDSQARFAMMSDTTTDARSSVMQAKLNLDASNDQVKAAEAAHWPQVSISSSYSPVAYPNNLFPNWSDWYTNWTGAINLSIPIYTGGSIEGNVNMAEGGVEQANARLEQAREAAAMDARVSMNALHSAKANLRSTASTASEAQRAYDIATVRFQQGISTEVELENARIQEEQARENWASAVRNYQVARAKLSLLKDLPVNPAQAQVAASTAQSGITQQQSASPNSQTTFTTPSSGASPSGMPSSQ
ncbi:MAG TPA: TolC family protein [Candidatus Kapabacteria bacterium]|jgi:outer membrane protein TolC